jgi:hypothetical protein
MSDIEKDIEIIKDPRNIQEALFASGPHVLMKAFEKDPIVIRLIRAGLKVVPRISAEIKENGLRLDTITLSCFAYILQKVDIQTAAAVIKPLFIQAMKKPDPFFIYFAAHTLRQNFKLPFKVNDPEYTFGELQETLVWIERMERTNKGGENA